MKTSQQVIGLPVISISDGIEIGNVKNAIVNATRGTVDYFVVDSGLRALPGGVIPVENVLGIGEDALTILNPEDVSEMLKTPSAMDLLQRNVTVAGVRVMTRKGTMMGETGDFYLDEDAACAIVGVLFIPRGGLPGGIISRESIITFGKSLLVVKDDFLDHLKETATVPSNVSLFRAEPVTAAGPAGQTAVIEMQTSRAEAACASGAAAVVSVPVEIESETEAAEPKAQAWNPAEPEAEAAEAATPEAVSEVVPVEEIAVTEAAPASSFYWTPEEADTHFSAEVDVTPQNEALLSERDFAPQSDAAASTESSATGYGTVADLLSQFESVSPAREDSNVETSPTGGEGGYANRSLDDFLASFSPEPSASESNVASHEAVAASKDEIPDYGAFDYPVGSVSAAPKQDSVADLFSERQRQFLRGRHVTRTIADSQGRTIIRAGEIITDEVIEMARSNEVLVDLVMNNES